MNEYKIHEYITFPMGTCHTEKNMSCFVVYSTKEEHINNVIHTIEEVFNNENSYNVILLGENTPSGKSQFQQLMNLLDSTALAIVVLDGFRPNVIFEYGVLSGLKKPCIVLLEKNAKVDIKNYFPEDFESKMENPKIDIDKQFSDVKDNYYIAYDKNNLKELKTKLEDHYLKIEEDVESTLLDMMIPGHKTVEEGLNRSFFYILKFSQSNDSNAEIDFHVSVENINRLVSQYDLKLSDKYYLLLAENYRLIGRYDDALLNTEKALGLNPNNLNALSAMAFVYKNLDEYKKCIESIDKAIKIKPESEPMWHNKGLLLELFEKKEEARLCYEKALKLDQTCARLHYDLSLILVESEKFDEAMDRIDDALKIDPHNHRYLLVQSIVYNKKNHKEKALESIKESISFNPENSDAWFHYGKMTSSQIESNKYFDKALEINPNHVGALCSKAAKLSNLGYQEEALTTWGKVKEICERNESCATLLTNIGLTEYILYTKNDDEHNRIDSALACFEKALPFSEGDERINLLNNIGYLKIKKGFYDDAIKYLAESNDPNNGFVKYNLALAYFLNGNKNQAQKYAEEAIQISNDDNEEGFCLLSLDIDSQGELAVKEKFNGISILEEARNLMKSLKT